MSGMLSGNTRWEANRMMLFEHRDLLSDRKQAAKKVKPNIDEQQLEEMSYVIHEAMENDVTVAVTRFGSFKDEVIIGKLTRIDQQSRRLVLQENDEMIVIFIDEILAIQLEDRK
jgi:DNA-binding LytR/AlgR family response regulator